MTKFILAAGVAALAIAAPAAAKPDHGGGGKNKGAGAKVERGGGARAAKSDRGGARHAIAQRGEQRHAKKGGDDRRMAKAEHKGRNELRGFKADRDDRRLANRIDRRDVLRVRDFDDDRFDRRLAVRGLDEWCPPGLDKKINGCLPPGQAKKLVGQMIPAAYRERMLPLGLRDMYRDSDDYYYRYGDGYLYQVNRQDNLVAALLPLMGLGYNVGQPFPAMYMNSYVPDYYRPFYADTGGDYYRFANGYIYEVDGRTGLIEDIDPAYGYGYGVGQLMPASYSYYNVPSQYRSLYYDTDDYYYRYAPGAIYQVDRQSSLVTAVASLLAGDLGVGSRLPAGYSAYNVPLAYRAQYYDTPTAWYRYNDGYIYRVDPTTQLVTAVINALV